jgi:nanoRNase/pAp phosphatase (c-di-AMP/oligoRNAs hydrolase)
MHKQAIPTAAMKNRIIANIIDALVRRQGFLLLVHQSPDEDCIASTVAFALLAGKFAKRTRIYVGKPIHPHFQYLINICTFNSIPVLYRDDPIDGTMDTVVLFDTPKPGMMETNEQVQRLIEDGDVLKIEIDHHLGADSDYFGQEGYRLVTEASSASELVGQILLQLNTRKAILRRFQINDLMSRNIVLAVLTGIIGDSKMGMYLKTAREKRYYNLFSRMFNRLLVSKTTRATNFSDMTQVFQEIQRLSLSEERCFKAFVTRKCSSQRISYVALEEEESRSMAAEFDPDTVVSVARAVADVLAEESGCLGLVCYYDDPSLSELVQFRIRRSHRYKQFDLRKVLELFQIENGGGHEGAIGFRVPRTQVAQLRSYVLQLIGGIEKVLPD